MGRALPSQPSQITAALRLRLPPVALIWEDKAWRATSRAGVGLTDISARTYIRQQLANFLMTLAVPFKMYREMEDLVSGSFLERPVWRKLAPGKQERN